VKVYFKLKKNYLLNTYKERYLPVYTFSQNIFPNYVKNSKRRVYLDSMKM